MYDDVSVIVVPFLIGLFSLGYFLLDYVLAPPSVPFWRPSLLVLCAIEMTSCCQFIQPIATVTWVTKLVSKEASERHRDSERRDYATQLISISLLSWRFLSALPECIDT